MFYPGYGGSLFLASLYTHLPQEIASHPTRLHSLKCTVFFLQQSLVMFRTAAPKLSIQTQINLRVTL